MSKSSDPGHFFQTSHSLAEISRKSLKAKNHHGSPIRLQSKILAIICYPGDLEAVYVAESAGTARRVVLETAETSHVYRGPTAPLTSLAFSTTSSSDSIFAGCWDKSIWSWNRITRAAKRRYFGHSDFVKALLCVRVKGKEVLLSGSADASIIVWDITSGEKLHALKGGHTKGILDLAVDPITRPSSPLAEHDGTSIAILSAGSDREIRRWRISNDFSTASEMEHDKPILQHETSVYRLHFDADDDLWTASADGSVKCLARERGWQADTTLVHGDYVRAVAIDERGGWVLSAGRDEDLKIWHRASGRLHHTFSGHFDEITGMVLIGQMVVTVSIDATIRRWSLKAEDLGKAVREADEAKKGVEKDEEVAQKKGLITDDEERELAELMGSDSD
ncbi:WD40-repeat-containing domain protein [Usnea florida]